LVLIGGLTAAAVLARPGVDVTVLEAHSIRRLAGTFITRASSMSEQLWRAVSTGWPMDQVGRLAYLPGLHPADPAMAVHLLDSDPISLSEDER
jgi:2-polyprenyl-6-methoxyphenol hydroxylase-like FAD-dependent oxidoreductase